MSNSVIQPWLHESGASLKQQTVMLSALRGCDGMPKEDPSKPFIRWYRSTILVNANPNQGGKSFMGQQTMPVPDCLTDNMDHYPVHWWLHFLHGVQLVGRFHPDADTRGEATFLYRCMIDAMHVGEETPNENDKRLGREPNLEVPFGATVTWESNTLSNTPIDSGEMNDFPTYRWVRTRINKDNLPYKRKALSGGRYLFVSQEAPTLNDFTTLVWAKPIFDEGMTITNKVAVYADTVEDGNPVWLILHKHPDFSDIRTKLVQYIKID